MFCEPHSTKQIEDAIGWGLETDPETLAATVLGPWIDSAERTRELCEQVSCPVLVIHGENDLLRPAAIGRALAEAIGGRFVGPARLRPRAARPAARPREHADP